MQHRPHVREVPDPDGGVALELWVEGSRLGRAAASADILADMRAMLHLDRNAVAAELRSALLEFLKNELDTVEISEPVEDPGKKLHFHSKFTLKTRDLIRPGVVWYDGTESTTRPEGLPAIARNKMRHEVHQKPTDPRN